MKAEFYGSVPDIQSAIKISGNGAIRLQVDVPETGTSQPYQKLRTSSMRCGNGSGHAGVKEALAELEQKMLDMSRRKSRCRL